MWIWMLYFEDLTVVISGKSTAVLSGYLFILLSNPCVEVLMINPTGLMFWVHL